MIWRDECAFIRRAMVDTYTIASYFYRLEIRYIIYFTSLPAMMSVNAKKGRRHRRAPTYAMLYAFRDVSGHRLVSRRICQLSRHLRAYFDDGFGNARASIAADVSLFEARLSLLVITIGARYVWPRDEGRIEMVFI